MREPAFTVVMPLYNHAAYVGAAIDSVLAQTFGDFELVICNDGSTDASLEVATAYRDDRLRVINKPNGGTVTALNSCLLKSEGTFVCWLSSDDLFSPGKLQAHHDLHAAHPEAPISVAPFGYLRDGEQIADTQVRVPDDARLMQFVNGNYINGLSVCAHRRVYGLYGQFDNRYRFAHDVERWFRFFKHEVPAFLTGTPLSHSRLDSSVTADADLLGMLDVLKILCNELQVHGLRGLLPAAPARSPLTLDMLAWMCSRLFGRSSLFARFDMRRHIVEVVATSLCREGRESLLPALMACFQRGESDADSRLVLEHLDDVASLIHVGEPQVSLSFVEHVVRLKSTVSSAAQRDVLDRYLRIGF